MIIIGIFLVLGVGVFLVSNFIEHRRQLIRDGLARKLLGNGFDPEREKLEIMRLIDGASFLPPIVRCRICRGIMVKRNGRYGEFMGCSNYPKCKATSKVG